MVNKYNDETTKWGLPTETHGAEMETLWHAEHVPDSHVNGQKSLIISLFCFSKRGGFKVDHYWSIMYSIHCIINRKSVQKTFNGSHNGTNNGPI